MRAAPQRERFDRHETLRGFVDGATARAIRHARNPERVRCDWMRRTYPGFRNERNHKRKWKALVTRVGIDCGVVYASGVHAVVWCM